MEYATGPTSVLISWKRQISWPLRVIVSYLVTREPIIEAGERVIEVKQHSTVVSPDVTVLNITGLRSYTTYRVGVEPVVVNRIQMQSSYILVGKCMFILN